MNEDITVVNSAGHLLYILIDGKA